MNSKIKLFSILGLALCIQSAGLKDDTITKEDGTYIINTTELGKNIEGYNGPTPLKIYIKKNKVVKIEALKNQETPKYNARVKKSLLVRYEGMKLTKGKALPEVDGVTGATFTSNAVKENVRRGVDYYWKHK